MVVEETQRGRVERVRRRGQVLRRRLSGAAQGVTAQAAERTDGLRSRWGAATAVVSAAAWVLAGAAVVAFLVGWTAGWVELVAVALFIAVLLLVGLPFVLGSHQLESELDLSRDRVVVGERAHGALVLTNTSGRRLLPSVVDLPVGHGRASFELPSLPTGGRHEELFAIPTARRAVLDVGPVTSVRADPLSLLRREQDLTEQELLYVHPRTVRVEGSAAGLIRDLEGNSVRKLTESDVAFHALRDYVPGDDRRHIHWKTSARSGRLMVRQFEETRRSHLLILLSSRVDDYAVDDEFELAISIAGSLGIKVLADGQTLSALTSGQTLRARTSRQMLDQLSGVDYARSADRLSEVSRALSPEHAAASVAVMLGGSLTEVAEFRRARRHLPSDMRVLAIRCVSGGESVVKTMGDLTIVSIADLEELSSLLRRASL
ncbi:Protein of unknown function DUF58 [Nocardioides terrae]|uniref:DUF58 domain-containing protein n=1 Tax=Nocardioides terrae TaxID=574651 RepID=A0A1I1MJX1_9ACTN|nr:DUF58 domain-containing protein [Nocardioides terrae]SFC85425.1 Protein of unknown function DUF58 [Nocardioides terrae]